MPLERGFLQNIVTKHSNCRIGSSIFANIFSKCTNTKIDNSMKRSQPIYPAVVCFNKFSASDLHTLQVGLSSKLLILAYFNQLYKGYCCRRKQVLRMFKKSPKYYDWQAMWYLNCKDNRGTEMMKKIVILNH